MATDTLKDLWQVRIQQWQESGLSQTTWCEQNNLTMHQLSYWKRKLLGKPVSSKLVPLVVAHETPAALSNVTVSLPSGIKLDIQTDNLTQLVRELARL